MSYHFYSISQPPQKFLYELAFNLKIRYWYMYLKYYVNQVSKNNQYAVLIKISVRRWCVVITVPVYLVFKIFTNWMRMYIKCFAEYRNNYLLVLSIDIIFLKRSLMTVLFSKQIHNSFVLMVVQCLLYRLWSDKITISRMLEFFIWYCGSFISFKRIWMKCLPVIYRVDVK